VNEGHAAHGPVGQNREPAVHLCAESRPVLLVRCSRPPCRSSLCVFFIPHLGRAVSDRWVERQHKLHSFDDHVAAYVVPTFPSPLQMEKVEDMMGEMR